MIHPSRFFHVRERMRARLACVRRSALPGRPAAVDVRAFTVTEIIFVIGIIVIGFGVFTVSRINSPGSNLKAAQSEIAGLVDLARVQARVTLGNNRTIDTDAARLIVFAGRGSDEEKSRCLRQLQVVVPDPTSPNGNKWNTVGGVLLLQKGVYVVPPIPPQVAVGLQSWPSSPNRLSQFVSMNFASTNTASATSTVKMTVDGTDGSFYFTRFTSRATLGSNGDLIALSEGMPVISGSTDKEPMRFTNPQNIRAVRITQYGSPTLLNDVQDFP